MMIQVAFTLLILFSAILCTPQVVANTCNSTPNQGFSNSNYDVQLFEFQSAEDCCNVCEHFDECLYYNYIQDSSSSNYQDCFIRTNNAGQVSDSTSTLGNVGRSSTSNTCQGVMVGKDYDNGFIAIMNTVFTFDVCCDACSNFPGCVSWTWVNSTTTCYLHSSTSNLVDNSGTVTGVVGSTARPAQKRTGKRGISWFNSHSCSDLRLLTDISWVYNWSPYPDGNIVSCMNELGIEFVPMQWGSGGIDSLASNVWTDSSHLLAFNEPNFSSESNLTPEQAANLWPQIESVAAQNQFKIGSPSPSPGGNLSPDDWLLQFLGNCTNCKIDFLTIHVYQCDLGSFQYWISTLTQFNLPIWITEFACPNAGNTNNMYNFMSTLLPWLESTSVIERYAWYGTRLPPNDGYLGSSVSLFSLQDCALTDIGKYYNPHWNSTSNPPSSTSTSTTGNSSVQNTPHFTVLLLLFFVLLLNLYL